MIFFFCYSLKQVLFSLLKCLSIPSNKETRYSWSVIPFCRNLLDIFHTKPAVLFFFFNGKKKFEPKYYRVWWGSNPQPPPFCTRAQLAALALAFIWIEARLLILINACLVRTSPTNYYFSGSNPPPLLFISRKLHASSKKSYWCFLVLRLAGTQFNQLNMI